MKNQNNSNITEEFYNNMAILHKKMWLWLAKNPKNDKYAFIKEYPEYNIDGLQNHFDCYACLVGNRVFDNGCELCPLINSCIEVHHIFMDNYFRSLYKDDPKIIKTMSECALEIASIPWLSYQEWKTKVEGYNGSKSGNS